MWRSERARRLVELPHGEGNGPRLHRRRMASFGLSQPSDVDIMRSSVPVWMPFPAIGRFGNEADALKYSPRGRRPRRSAGGQSRYAARGSSLCCRRCRCRLGRGLDQCRSGGTGPRLITVFAPAWPRGCRRAGRHPCRRLARRRSAGTMAAGALSALRLPGLRQTGGVNASPSAEPLVGANAVGGPPTLAANLSASRLASCELRSIR